MTNLIDALNYVGSCLDRGGQIDMIYMDMSKAFDKVNHDVLIQKLRNNYGFGGNLLRWFRSYLTNRKQRVTVLGATSNPLSVTPQGAPFWSATRFYPWPSIVSLVRQRSAEYCEIKSSCNVRG